MFYYVSSVFYALSYDYPTCILCVSYVYPTCAVGGWDEPIGGCVCGCKGCVPAAG